MTYSTRMCSVFGVAGVLACLAGCGGDDEGSKDDGSKDGGDTSNGGGSNGGGSNGGGSNGGGSSKPPFQATGERLTGPDQTWTWVDFPDTKCRDGSNAGLGLSLNAASKKVMVFLEGGGACFNSLTCGLNPANASSMKGAHGAGLFNRNEASNPVKDWNYVYVPYCTGDVHVGTNDAGTIDGVAGTQHFVGRKNMEAYLQRIVPTFSDASQVLLTGISAGGFGAAASADLVQWAFGDVPVTLIDDSGPPMSSEFLPKCLQDSWRTTWGFDDSILKDCGADCPNHDDFTLDFALHLGKEFKGRPSGLVETVADGVITLFYGFGASDCTASVPVAPATFQAGLLDFRTKIGGVNPAFGTYFIAGTQHTWLSGPSLYTQNTGGTSLVSWVAGIVDGTGTKNVGP